jgi:hypothetical protein
MSKEIKTYRFINDYAVITFTVPGQSNWSEEEWDSAAQTDLESYVTTPEQYHMDDCFDTEDFINV